LISPIASDLKTYFCIGPSVHTHIGWPGLWAAALVVCSPSDCLLWFHFCVFPLISSCSKETRDKIRAGLRLQWKKHHQRLEIQATCPFDWQNLIAEAARKGLDDEEELQWDSYEILKKQLQQEWLHRARTYMTAPKSLEHRRKIAEAIAAKWADPVSYQPHQGKVIFCLVCAYIFLRSNVYKL